MGWVRYGGALLLAYFLGALPVGYLAAKLLKGIDVRRVGSGRIGGSNVLRAAGVLPAALTVLGDMAKGYGAVALAGVLVPQKPLVAALAGLLAVVGHNWPVFLGFKGGVGTMTTLGASLALLPPLAWAVFIAGALVVLLWRYTSLGSLTIAMGLPLACLVGTLAGGWPAAYLVFSLGSGLIAIWALRPNIQRLRQGRERKLGQTIPPGQADVTSSSPWSARTQDPLA